MTTMTPAQALTTLQTQIHSAVANHAPLHIRGGGSKNWYGHPMQDQATVLDTRAYQGVVDYDPAELVITARCGTPLAEIEQILAERRQMLAFEPPHYAAHGQATVGGMVAAGLSGPRRAAVGSVRDFILGAKLLDGRAQHLSFGGTVMKNVAGYDVARLLAGSLGTLGVITEVSLKVLPCPFAEASLRFAMSEDAALQKLNQWGGQPLPLSASAWCDGVLTVRLSGAEAAVKSAIAKLGGEQLSNVEAEQFWLSLREQTAAFFTVPAEQALWRISTPSTAAPLEQVGAQLLEWGGALRWWKTDLPADSVRQIAHAVGGHATLYRGGRPEEGVFTPLAPALQAIHQRLKNTFDPAHIFNVGRMY